MTKEEATDAKKKPYKHSAATIQTIKQKSVKNGMESSAQTLAKLEAAVAVIKEERARNGGAYLLNQGSLSGAEICRRAGVHPQTLFKPNMKAAKEAVDDLADDYKAWLAGKDLPGPKTRAERAQSWKEQYEKLSDSIRFTEMELVSTKSDLDAATELVAQLKAANEKLEGALSAATAGKIVPLRRR